MKRIIFLTLILACFFSAYPAPCPAMGSRPRQRILTSIEGRVIDQETGQGIPDASVELYGIGGQFLSSVNTDDSGTYFISGEYTSSNIIRVSAEGYEDKSSTIFLMRSKSHYIDIRVNPLDSSGQLKITSLSPSERSTFAVSDTIDISVETRNSGKGRVEYRYLIDTDLIQAWTASSNYSFQAQDRNRGRHTITVETKDNKGNSDSKSVNIYISRQFPKPNN